MAGNEVEIVITASDRTAAALASARARSRALGADLKGSLSKAGADAGKALGDGIAKGAEVRLRDARGRFVKAALPDPGEAERQGRSLGSRLARGITSSVSGAASRLKSALGSAVDGALERVLSTPAIVAGLAPVLGPMLGTLLSGSLVLGVGGAVTAIGVALLAEDDKVKKRWSSTWKELRETMTDAAKPLLPVMETARKQLASVVGGLAPAIERGFETAQKPMQRFVRSLGDGLKALEPAIGPLFESFGKVLDEIGPQLPEFFAGLADSFTDLANTVSDNRDLFADVFMTLLKIIPAIVDGLTWLTSVFRTVTLAALDFFDTTLGAAEDLMRTVADIPGPWQESARAIAESIADTRGRLSAYREDVETFPKIVKIEGDIRDLDTKLASARSQLKDPNLTATKRAKLEARIDQLLSAKARAQAAIDALKGKTVTLKAVAQTAAAAAQLGALFGRYNSKTVTITTIHRAISTGAQAGALGRAAGGPVGANLRRFANGGISSSGSSMALVGEQGPELVRLPVGSSVTPAGQTRSMMSASNSISMAFRAGGGATSTLKDVVEPLKDVAKTLRDIVTLRDGMDKLTGGIFGQTRALMGYEEAWDRARASLKENGKTLNITGEKGRENRSALLGLAEAAHEVWGAMRDLNKPMSAILNTVKEQRAEFIKMAKSFGLTSAQARAMADRLGLVPSKVKGILTKEAKDTAYNKAAEKFNAGLSGRAAGGPAGGWTLTGEQGPELVRLPFGSSVMPAGATSTYMGGGAPTRIELVVTGGSGGDMERMLMQMIRRFVRVNGGNVQTALGR